MTEKEKQVLQIISDNPMIEQEEIGKLLHISRSTVAVHISSLIKQGYLIGKGYVLAKDKYVVGIGAANVDVYGKSQVKIKTHYDHPSKINTSVGGVTRNVLENLSLLDVKTKLLSAVGNDIYGEMILTHSKNAGIDVSNVIKMDGYSSGLFMQVQDKDNDMYLALCDMSVNSNINKEYVISKDSIISNAKAIVLDPSINIEVIDYIVEKYANKIPIFIDPISENYAKKIKPYIGKIFACKPNRSELEVLSGIKINKDDDAIKAGRSLLNKGLKKVYISLGRKGSIYMDKQGNIINKKKKAIEKIVNASGAGDAFFATIIYAYMNDIDAELALDLANAAGAMALNSASPINPNLSIKSLYNEIK